MRTEKNITSVVGLGIILAAAVVLSVGMIRGENTVTAYWDLLKSREILEQAVQGLEKENRQLSSEITKIRTSGEYAKRVLKDKYHLTEPNETILFYADE